MHSSSAVWFVLVAVGALLLGAAGGRDAKIRIGASITDLASIASQRRRRPGRGLRHRPGATPTRTASRCCRSYMVQVSRAQLYLKVGLGLDQWADGIIDGSRNTKLQVRGLRTRRAGAREARGRSTPRWATCTRTATRTTGSIRATARSWRRRSPSRSRSSTRRTRRSTARAPRRSRRRCDAALARGQRASRARCRVRTILTYHRSWVYFATPSGSRSPRRSSRCPASRRPRKHLPELVEIAKAREDAGVAAGAVLLRGRRQVPGPRGRRARGQGLALVRRTRRPGSYLAHIDALARRRSPAARPRSRETP